MDLLDTAKGADRQSARDAVVRECGRDGVTPEGIATKLAQREAEPAELAAWKAKPKPAIPEPSDMP